MRLVHLIAAAFLSAAPSLAQGQPAGQAATATPSPVLAFRGGHWFDGQSFVAGSWYSVDGRLTSVRPARIDAEIDMEGRYLLPSLIEAHNHDAQSGPFGAFSNVKNMEAGVFHSVQMCSRPDQREGYEGFFGQPGMMTVAFTDACISSSDGHPLGIALASARQGGMEMTAEEARRQWDVIDNLADLDRVWPQIAARQPKLVKVIAINSERREADRANPDLFGFLGIDPALARPIVERAHAAGARVAIHADSARDFAVAVDAGADIIAHLPGYRFAQGMSAADYRIDDATIDAAARRGTIVITTAVAATHDMRRHPANAPALRAMQIENVSRLRTAGVRLALGSDAAMGTVIDEILYLDALGVFPRHELLRIATRDTARAMFPDAAIGLFREGAEANVIAYAQNPLTDLSALRRPVLRVQRGSLLAGSARR